MGTRSNHGYTRIRMESEADADAVPFTTLVVDDDTLTLDASGDARIATGTGTAWTERALSEAEFADFADAISTLGSNATLVVDEGAAVSTNVVVPASIFLRIAKGAKLTKSGSGTIEFEGLGLDNPDHKQPIFSGFAAGDITWSGTVYPHEISTEWWDTANISLTDRVNCADGAVVGKSAKLVAYPRTITNAAVITSYHWLYFTTGDYPNVLDTFDNSHFLEPTFKWPAFLLQDHTRVSGAPGHKVYESPHDGNGYMFYAYHTRYAGGETLEMCEDIIIEDLYLVGDEDQVDISGGNSCVLLGNCHNGAIRNCTFERTHSYTAVLGLFGEGGNYAYNSEISNCIFIGIGTQAAVILNGKNCRIRGNTFDQHDSVGTASYSILDIEPNTGSDVIENLLIENNVFDMRDTADGSKYCWAILTQAALDGSIKNLTIRHNTIFGADIYPEPANFNPLTIGIHIYGVLEGYVYGNTIRGAFQRGIKVEQSKYIRVFDNNGMQNSDVIPDNIALELNAVAASDIYHNIFSESFNAARQSTGIREGEMQHTVTTSGANVTSITNLGLFNRFYDLYENMTVTVNNADYIVDTVTTQHALSTTTSIGTLAQKTFVDADVNTGTENIAITAHGHNTGSFVLLTTTGAVPTGLVNNQRYYVIRVDANNLKLASTYANAQANTPVNITAASGGGTHALTAVMVTKFSSNTFRDNKADDGLILEPTGTSVVYSTYRTRLDDYVPSDLSIGFGKLAPGELNTVLGILNPVTIDPVTWQNMILVSQSGADNKLTKTGADGWDGGASSSQTISGDGYLEFTITETTTNRLCGLSQNDTDQNYASIEYAFQVENTTIRIWESGTNRGSFGTAVANTTVLKIERSGTVITFYIDGGLQYTSTVPSTGALKVDTSLYTNGGTVGGVVLGGFGSVDTLTPAEVRTLLDPLDADTLNGATFAAPGAIGGGTAAPGTFTTLNAASLNLGGATVTDVLTGTATLDFDLTTNVSQDLTITVTGAAVGDSVILGIPNGSITADTVYTGWVSAADTVTIRAARLAGTPDPASGTFRATVIKI